MRDSINSRYLCIMCGEVQIHCDADELRCARCGARYPVIEGIPVFLPRPHAALRAYLTGHADVERTFGELGEAIQRAEASLPTSGVIERGRRMTAAMARDLGLLRAVHAPIRAYLQGHPGDDDFLAWASVQTGLSLHDMFVYFYQDWSGAPEFASVATEFRRALGPRPDRPGALAVLGAGACGLAHALAPRFDATFAVDLSLPTLLLVRRFLGGEPLELHLKQANWRAVELVPPPDAAGAIELVAANVTNLPFASGSLAVVATQCLLDIVDNPLHLAEEIHRVLEPGGLWINFSHAFHAPGDPIELGPRRLDEVPAVLAPLGFEPRWLGRRRFVMLNTELVDPEPPRTDEEVHFFGFSKQREPAAPARFRTLRDQLVRSDPACWELRPAPVPGREISLAERRSFSGRGGQARCELRVGPYPMPIPPEYAELLARLLADIDGSRTLRDVFRELRGAGADVTEAGFLQIVHTLAVERQVIALGAAQAAN